jgi:hypothetical protein
LEEKEILENFPDYLKLFEESNKKGITFDQELTLYNKLGLQVERQLNPTIKGWAEYLQNHGPLSITVDATPPYGGTIHAIVLLAIFGEDSGLETKVIYADPADGKLYEKDFLEFLKMYEAKLSVDWPLQIVHF